MCNYKLVMNHVKKHWEKKIQQKLLAKCVT